jgi:uncharacterized membrane protein YgaE (UPF0421/DUF939 family)
LALTSLAAALAWLIAHRGLGHPQPFFAPIAAAIALSTSRIQRSRRIAQMVIGVLLGIGIGEVLAALLGTSTVALGVIVFVTLTAALAIGVGFFGEGMMFANQAAASAILVVTLHSRAPGGERAVDAIVGGAVALLLGVGLFPAQPVPILHEAERSVLRTLADSLQQVATLLGAGTQPHEDWPLRAGHKIHEELGALARARAAARANVRIAPRRWRVRAAVDAESRRIAQLDLLANAVLSLVRSTTSSVYGRQPIPSSIREQIGALADALQRLASTPQPWPAELRTEIVGVTNGAIESATEDADAPPLPRANVVAAIVRATAADLSSLIASGAGGTMNPTGFG